MMEKNCCIKSITSQRQKNSDNLIKYKLYHIRMKIIVTEKNPIQTSKTSFILMDLFFPLLIKIKDNITFV